MGHLHSAFANTYGETILLGVYEYMTEKKQAKRFEIIGVEDADKNTKTLVEYDKKIGEGY